MTPITDGTCKFVVTKSGGVLPGTVTAFSGTFNNGCPIDKNTGLVDKEWHLCDGTNGTPDLRNRFIYGGDGTNNGATGGESSHTLTVKELPAISGTVGSRIGANGGIFERPATGVFSYQDPEKGRTYASQGDHSGSYVTYNTAQLSFGGDQPHNNMPPYYVLAFMMKL